MSTSRYQTGFASVHAEWPWDEVSRLFGQVTVQDVESLLERVQRPSPERLEPRDFITLLSPAAAQFLEPMAQFSRDLTRQRFGRAMQLYAPLYLSNECANTCTYCGFSQELKIERKTLTDAEILAEARILKDMGYDHVLLVTGEAPKTVGVPYLAHAMDLLRPLFSQISIEVQPLETEEYSTLMEHGLSAVLVYQETYHRETYKLHHPGGKKSIFDWRLATPDRLGAAHIPKIGLGCLLGLEEWRVDAFFVALHLHYLERSHWRSRFSLSFPRLRPHAGGIPVKSPMSDRELVQLICAYRIFNPEVELSLSTRESERFRDHVCQLGITSMSAGSRTNPGGYAAGSDSSLEQFEISDERSPAQIAAMLEQQGFQPVWKDWDAAYDAMIHTSPNQSTTQPLGTTQQANHE
jgi:2-iminoacetate synthase